MNVLRELQKIGINIYKLRSVLSANNTSGLSAYQIAVNNGFVGDEASWLNSLKGEAGQRGNDGTNGQGIPTGGLTDQILAKIDSENFNTKWVTPSNGNSDPWTYVKLTSDFTISTTANNSITELNFTPEANKTYEIEGRYLLQSAVTTTGPRPGILWPAGYTNGAGWTTSPSSATAFVSNNHNPVTGTSNAASTGLPVINRSYLGTMRALLVMGASPSGKFQITLASEIASSNVTMKAGSFIRYREI